MTGPELFQAALKASGNEWELARRLGYENIQSAARQFERWNKGRTQMSFEHTIALLEIAGWLCVPEEVSGERSR
jgi:hypothetical protein